MIRLRQGRAAAIPAARPGVVEVNVEVDGERAAALVYPALVGPVAEGGAVVLNTTAVALGLGTGGTHLVVAVEGAEGTDIAHGGRVMKARYTPLQAVVRSVEETHRDVLETSSGLEGAPVGTAPLPSMVAVVAAGAKAAGAHRRAGEPRDGHEMGRIGARRWPCPERDRDPRRAAGCRSPGELRRSPRAPLGLVPPLPHDPQGGGDVPREHCHLLEDREGVV